MGTQYVTHFENSKKGDIAKIRKLKVSQFRNFEKCNKPQVFAASLAEMKGDRERMNMQSKTK